MATFQKQSNLPVSADEAFNWHSRVGAFERLSPPWQRVEIIEKTGTIRNGDQLTMRVKTGPIWKKWVALHDGFEQGRQFKDTQVHGPFARWEHTHRFEPLTDGTSRLVDHIDYALPLGAVGRSLGGRSVKRTLNAVFNYRHRLTTLDLAMHHRYADKPRMTVAITGASGVIGSALAALLTTGGHRVIRLVRGDAAPSADAARWSGGEGIIDLDKVEAIDAIVHLAGENVAGGRWTDARKKRILESRSIATQALTKSLAKLKQPPRVFIGASAIGYYGNGGEQPLDETSPKGDGFLAQVCQQWEQAISPAAALGLRTVSARIGIVLTPKGGALAKMLTPFKLGAGGPIGSGQQFMSWISLDDVIAALHHLLMNDQITGPVNLVAPHAVTQREFAKTLGRVLHRPSFAPLPAFVARLVFGQMADEMLLKGANVLPRVLSQTQYTFRDPILEETLRWCLGLQTNVAGNAA